MAAKDRLARLRRAILREWRGGDEPEHLDSKVHKPDEFLAEILKAAGAADGIEIEKLREMWREIAGEFVARSAAPDSLKNGCLTLKVLQPAMRFHLEQMKGQLLANLKKAAGDGVVKSIRFSLG
jgi:predicted nucleic acid-binding Zn ribbon protein